MRRGLSACREGSERKPHQGEWESGRAAHRLPPWCGSQTEPDFPSTWFLVFTKPVQFQRRARRRHSEPTFANHTVESACCPSCTSEGPTSGAGVRLAWVHAVRPCESLRQTLALRVRISVSPDCGGCSWRRSALNGEITLNTQAEPSRPFWALWPCSSTIWSSWAGSLQGWAGSTSSYTRCRSRKRATMARAAAFRYVKAADAWDSR